MADVSKTIPLVKETFTSSGVPRASWQNKIGREINLLSSSPDLIKTPTGYRYKTGPAVQPWTFQHSQTKAVITVTAGTVSYGSSDIAFAGGSVTLTGTPEFVYIRLERTLKTLTLGHASTRPQSDSTYAYFVLASFSAIGSVYSLTAVHHKGDIYLQVPMQ